MKLSIIVPIYKKSKNLNKYLERLSKINSKSYEIIFVVDTNYENVIQVIESFLPKLKGDHKLIYNSKRSGRNNAIELGIANGNGDYLMIHSLTNRFEEDFVNVLLKEAQSKMSDVIEFVPQITSPIKFKPKLRKKFNKPTKIADDPSILAYAYPMIFNKIFKKEIAQKTLSMPSISKKINNRFSVELLYKILITASTYSTMENTAMKSNIKEDEVFNPLNLAREWDKILNHEIFQPYYQELMYARYFNGFFMIYSFIKTFKNKMIEEKFWKKFHETFPPGGDLFTLNKYYLSNTKESKIMREFKNKKSNRAYKEL